MQTFLPYPNYAKSAEVLDMKRLGKQRVETYQILRRLAGITNGTGWANHPAVKMWEGHGLHLIQYNIAICEEWIGRGYKDTVLDKTLSLIGYFQEQTEPPSIIGNREFHKSHKSNLLRKYPEHYKKYFKNVPDDLPYIWTTGGN